MDQARALLADNGEERFNASQDGFSFVKYLLEKVVNKTLYYG
jgi:hypothetical protein